MSRIDDGQLLWTPPADRLARSHLTHYLAFLEQRGRKFADYGALWRWSVQDLEGFWQSIVEFCGVRFSKPAAQVLGRREMPGAEWFPGATLNYAQHALRHERDGADALVHLSERRPLQRMSWPELGRQVRVLATKMRSLGLAPGDRVVAYLPNTPEALVAMYATASIGAVWSSCGPDFGARGVLDRYSQLQPKLMFCVDGYSYGGKLFDRRAEIRSIIEQLTSLSHVVFLPYLDPEDLRPLTPRAIFW